MKKSMTLLVILNIAFAAVVGVNDVLAQEGEVTITLLPDKIQHSDCKPQDCNGSAASTGSGSTLTYGCTFNAGTSTCTGTCYRCNGNNPSGRTEICFDVTTDEKCQPDANNASFTCGTGDAKTCNAPGADSALSCCSTNSVTPAATGGDCGGVTCLDI